MEKTYKKYDVPSSRQFYLISLAAILNIVFFCFLIISLCSCNISFKNINTHGYANDLVEEKQQTGDL
jgi:hypothetical protein